MRGQRTSTTALLSGVIAIAIAAATTVWAEPLETGAPAPDFSLPATDGKTYSLADFESADVLAVLFTCNHCPTAQAYEERVKKMVVDYADESFALVAISPNDPLAVRLDELGYSIAGDSFEDMKVHAEAYGFNFPYLYDGENQAVSKAFGVLATPHVYVFDRDRMLRYQGRIDDNEKGDAIKSHDARNAVDALLAGRDVPVATTRVFGCSTKWADKRGSLAQADEAWEKRPVTLEPIDTDGVRQLAANGTEKLRLINLWATWCGPCVAEMPDLVAVNRIYQGRGFELVTVSLDDASAREEALKVLTRLHVAASAPVADSLAAEGRPTNNYIFTDSDKDALAAALDPEWPGPIPYSVLVAPGGKVIYRHSGALDPVELRKAIVGHLGRTY